MTEWTAGEFRFPTVVIPPTAAVSPEAAIRFLVEYLVELRQIEPEHALRVQQLVLSRESLGSTGIGRGAAIPHSISNVVERVVGLVGHYLPGLQWPNAID